MEDGLAQFLQGEPIQLMNAAQAAEALISLEGFQGMREHMDKIEQ
jgi:hypothetical protein